MRGTWLAVLGCVIVWSFGCARQPVDPTKEWSQRMEALEQEQHTTAQTQQELERRQQDLQNRLFALEAGWDGLEVGIAAMSVLEAKSRPEPEEDESVAVPTAVPAVPAKSQSHPVPSVTHPEYDRALQLVLSGKIDEGRNARMPARTAIKTAS